MTRSPASTCAVGESSLLPTLRRLLLLAEPHRGDETPYDEVRKWDDGLLDAMMALDLMREGKRADDVYLEECLQQPWAEPVWRTNPKTGKRYGVYCCYDPDCAGSHTIDPERMRVWELDWDGLCRAVASAAKARGPMTTDADSRVTMLGSITREETTRELFLVRGLSRRDGPAVFAAAARLTASPNATVLFCGDMPEPQQRRPNWRTVLVLSEIVTLHRGKLALPLHRLFEDQTLPAAPAATRPALAEQDLDVLQALAEKPDHSLTMAELIAASGYGKKALRATLARLAQLGYTQRPTGTTRKGVTISASGVAFLDSPGARRSA